MGLDIWKEKGVPMDKQVFTWRDLVRSPISKLDADALSRVRIILMNGIESEAVRFQHAAARMSRELRHDLAAIRRVEHHQQTLVNWLNPPDQSPLETTLGFEQVAIEVTASVAQNEPDPYMAQIYRFGLLEDFDHLYRYSALYDRVEGKDANVILQNYTDILPGRPTSVEHRAPTDDVRNPYQRAKAGFVTKLNALTIMSGENQTRDYYMTIGPMFADPTARQLYAEIASIEEQHVTQYESLIDPEETLLEKWLLHEAGEVYNYFSCMEYESDARLLEVWERFCNYELGHFHYVSDLLRRYEQRDPEEVIAGGLPDPIRYESHRSFVRQVLREEVDLRADGAEIVPAHQLPADHPSERYREQMNRDGSPSDDVAANYVWIPGTELAAAS